MNDQDRKRIEETQRILDAIHKECRHQWPGACAECIGERMKDWSPYLPTIMGDLLAIIDRERVATREDVERVAEAIFLAYGVGTTERVGWAVDAARAALRAMGRTVEDE